MEGLIKLCVCVCVSLCVRVCVYSTCAFLLVMCVYTARVCVCVCGCLQYVCVCGCLQYVCVFVSLACAALSNPRPRCSSCALVSGFHTGPPISSSAGLLSDERRSSLKSPWCSPFRSRGQEPESGCYQRGDRADESHQTKWMISLLLCNTQVQMGLFLSPVPWWPKANPA